MVKQWADVATQNLSFSISDLLLSVYFIGFTYHLRKLLAGLLQIKRLRLSSQLLEINDAYRVYSQSNFPSFSFLQTIFLNQEVEQLTNAEKEMVLMHERIHIVQKHTYDILLLEAFGVLFWFNPAVGYLKNALKLVHEYLVDEVIANKTRDIYAYGTLLVKLSQSKAALSLSHTFSNHQIFRRITMLTKPKSNSIKKLNYLAIFPLLFLVIVLCSYIEGGREVTFEKKGAFVPATNLVPFLIRNLTWKGNTIFTDEELNEVFHLDASVKYASKEIEDLLYGTSTLQKNVTSMYMDKGYLFFRVEVEQKEVEDKQDIVINLFEGPIMNIGEIIVTGNKKVSRETALQIINIKPGEVFNRSKVILAQKALAASGIFNASNININPIPHPAVNGETGTVDFEFIVEEI